MTIPATKRLWRSLVRVMARDPRQPLAYVTIPGWNPGQVVELELSRVPQKLRPRFKAGARLHARVNVGAERADDLMFAEWESS